jgi:hypothetical protein
MGVVGLEPTQPCDQQILSLVRLPFRHTPKLTCKGKSTNLTIKSKSMQAPDDSLQRSRKPSLLDWSRRQKVLTISQNRNYQCPDIIELKSIDLTVSFDRIYEDIVFASD